MLHPAGLAGLQLLVMCKVAGSKPHLQRPHWVRPMSGGRDLGQPLVLPPTPPHPTHNPNFIVVRHLLELQCQIIEETHFGFQECLPLARICSALLCAYLASEMVSADLPGTGPDPAWAGMVRRAALVAAAAGMRRRGVETSLPCVKRAAAAAATR